MRSEISSYDVTYNLIMSLYFGWHHKLYKRYQVTCDVICDVTGIKMTAQTSTEMSHIIC